MTSENEDLKNQIKLLNEKIDMQAKISELERKVDREDYDDDESSLSDKNKGFVNDVVDVGRQWVAFMGYSLLFIISMIIGMVIFDPTI